MNTRLFRMICSPIVNHAARRALLGRSRCRREPERGRFTRDDVGAFVAQTWRRYGERVVELPAAGTVGGRMNLRFACLTLSLLDAFMDAGIERAYAIELVADAAWQVYEKWSVLPWVLARLGTRDPVARLQRSLRAFLRFPFNPPAYRFDVVSHGDGFAIDMRRCPIAEYLGGQQAADLCVGAWCNLDYGLAEMWGGRLERHSTLAGGGDRCDFRFRVAGRLP